MMLYNTIMSRVLSTRANDTMKRVASIVAMHIVDDIATRMENDEETGLLYDFDDYFYSCLDLMTCDDDDYENTRAHRIDTFIPIDDMCAKVRAYVQSMNIDE